MRPFEMAAMAVHAATSANSKMSRPDEKYRACAGGARRRSSQQGKDTPPLTGPSAMILIVASIAKMTVKTMLEMKAMSTYTGSSSPCESAIKSTFSATTADITYENAEEAT